MATLSEVARLAGVTTATVSNVLRNPKKVKASTVKRVEAAIAETGYRPNLMARALAEGRSSMVAMIVPSITNPFYPEFFRVAERVARNRQYFLLVCNTDEQAEIGRAYLRQIAGTLADGVLVLHAGIGPKEILEIGGRRSPVVLASEEVIEVPAQIPQVIVNFRKAGLLAGRHLIALGHRKIGTIVGGGLAGLQQVRLQGFKEALTEAGIPFDETWARDVDDSIPGGREAAASLLRQEPGLTAIFATNDLLAFGASQALTDMSFRIPQDVSLIGITDIQLAQEMRPALTTIALRIEEIAKLSVNLLLDLVENPNMESIKVIVPDPELILRSSTRQI